ncbi:FYVE, RhoGEF and PH domain-containing protein 5 [Galemys pyrenaicus]|uniref:FYVE, RhoGEF and PH domain-containing protein 5 n=1 Tax=Galemys pyrenaicus TaxID=202257 RepID=A0A8J6ADD0_GALPY|nr:FYVE, RhoGEF and PH domain-containing protein 5 [Galemys pyrenaicus]
MAAAFPALKALELLEASFPTLQLIAPGVFAEGARSTFATTQPPPSTPHAVPPRPRPVLSGRGWLVRLLFRFLLHVPRGWGRRVVLFPADLTRWPRAACRMCFLRLQTAQLAEARTEPLGRSPRAVADLSCNVGKREAKARKWLREPSTVRTQLALGVALAAGRGSAWPRGGSTPLPRPRRARRELRPAPPQGPGAGARPRRGLERAADARRLSAASRAAPDPALASRQVAASGEGSAISGYLSRCKKGRRPWKKLWFVVKGKVLYTYAASEVDTVALESIPLLGFTIAPEKDEDSREVGPVFHLFHKKTLFYSFKAEDASSAQRALRPQRSSPRLLLVGQDDHVRSRGHTRPAQLRFRSAAAAHFRGTGVRPPHGPRARPPPPGPRRGRPEQRGPRRSGARTRLSQSRVRPPPAAAARLALGRGREHSPSSYQRAGGGGGGTGVTNSDLSLTKTITSPPVPATPAAPPGPPPPPPRRLASPAAPRARGPGLPPSAHAGSPAFPRPALRAGGRPPPTRDRLRGRFGAKSRGHRRPDSLLGSCRVAADEAPSGGRFRRCEMGGRAGLPGRRRRGACAGSGVRAPWGASESRGGVAGNGRRRRESAALEGAETGGSRGDSRCAARGQAPPALERGGFSRRNGSGGCAERARGACAEGSAAVREGASAEPGPGAQGTELLPRRPTCPPTRGMLAVEAEQRDVSSDSLCSRVVGALLSAEPPSPHLDGTRALFARSIYLVKLFAVVQH